MVNYSVPPLMWADLLGEMFRLAFFILKTFLSLMEASGYHTCTKSI